MKTCFQNIMPDSLTGTLFAVEGIKDAAVILNGPTGCKFYHSAVSDDQFQRQLAFDPLNYPEEFYFGQPRIPCTYLDGYDYVYGSNDKLTKVLKKVEKKNYSLLAVVNSPGAALIGDDLNRLIKDEIKDTLCFTVESTGFSGSFQEGFQRAVIQILSLVLGKREEPIPKSVNLIGISIYDKYYEGNIKEVKRLLNLCGIDVLSTICAGDDIKHIKNSLKAEYNIVLYPEYGLEIAKWMYEKYSIPYIVPGDGVPIGFDGTEKWIENICRNLGTKNDLFIKELEEARARSYLYLSRFHSITGLPKGATFSIKGKSSMVYALSKWLYTYLGMIPVSIEIIEGMGNSYYQSLFEFLENIGYECAIETSIHETPGHIVFADGNTILQLRMDKKNFTGIEISLPSIGYIHVIPKSIFGITGGLMILEEILNGLRFIEGF